MKYSARCPDREISLDFVNPGAHAVVVDGQEREFDLEPTSMPGLYSLLVDQVPYEVFVRSVPDGYAVYVDGDKFNVAVEDERARRLKSLIPEVAKSEGAVEMRAPMPGLIVKIYVHEGDVVEQGQSLFIIEAMKMENEIGATRDGRVRRIARNEGEAVEKNALIMTLE